MRHSGGLWFRGRPYYTRLNALRIEIGPDDGSGQFMKTAAIATSEESAQRIVACVNACDELIDPGVVPELLELVKRLSRSAEASEAMRRSAKNTLARALLASAESQT